MDYMQEYKGEEHESNTAPSRVLVLGMYHFSNSGGHAVNVEVSDVMTDQKQKEIDEVLAKLQKFGPDKIAVEVPAESSDKFNRLYQEYCSNSYTPGRSEMEQIGFRLAGMLNHQKIYPIDVRVPLPFEPMMESAQKNMPKLYEHFQREIAEMAQTTEELQKSAAVSEILKYYNDPVRISEEHSSLYLNLAQIGAQDTYYGADFLSAWYDRNIRIFANLQSITEPGDKVLVIYGAGHAKILRDFISSYKKMELVDTMQYL
jgi:hypothetical protein